MSEQPPIRWKIGVEIETIAPRGVDRSDLAWEVARRHGGKARRVFHPQSEPSLVPGTPVFENLTLGFVAESQPRRPFARFVDDLTLQDDCDREAEPKHGWWRVVGDDARWLRLCARYADPEAALPEALHKFTAVLGTRPELGPGGMWRVSDEAGASVLIAAPLPGERERPCEIVTAPLDDDHEVHLESLLKPARDLGFFAPAEGAVHLHFDAAPLCSARTVARIIRLHAAYGPALRSLVRTNPRCRRLGPPQESVLALARDPAFASLSWPAAREVLKKAEPSKFLDLNLRNLALGTHHKHTVEVRILPVSLSSGPILAAMRLFEAFFRDALGDTPIPEEPVADLSGWLGARGLRGMPGALSASG